MRDAPLVDGHIHWFQEGSLPARWYDSIAQGWAFRTRPPRDPSRLDVEAGLIDPGATLLFEELERCNVTYAVGQGLDWGFAFGEPDVPIREAMRECSSVAQDSGGRVFFTAGIDPRRDDAIDLLQFAIRELGFVGLKLYPPSGFFPHDARALQLCGVAAELGVPVVFHSAIVRHPHRSRFANPVHLQDVQWEFPDLTIVIAHGGFPHWTGMAVEVAAGHPHTFLEISNWEREFSSDSDAYVRLLEDAVAAIGSHRIIYGSDHLGGRRFSGVNSMLGRGLKAISSIDAKRTSLTTDDVLNIRGRAAMSAYRLPSSSSTKEP